MPTIDAPVSSNNTVSSGQYQNTTSPKQTMDRSRSHALSCLALAFFTLGASSLCVVGAFDYIAADWHLSRTATALLVTAFSGTLGLCAPFLQLLFGHWPRRSQILTGISVMATGSTVMGVAPNYPVLFAARILMGLGAALAGPMILALGSTLVEPRLQGRALATVMMGMTVASVVSVPASTWAAAHIGPRWLFASIGFTTFIAVALIAYFVQNRSHGVRVKLGQFVDLVKRPANLAGLAVGFCSVAGSFVTYTMITPIMRDRYSAGPHLISLALLVFGIAGIGGNLIVGRAATSLSAEKLLATAMIVLVAVFTALLFLPISILSVLVALTIWPAMVAIILPSQQRRMVELEPGFRDIALALNSTFLFFGIAAGSSLGGVSYSCFGYSALPLFSILLICIGLVALRYSMRAKALQQLTHGVLGIYQQQG
jgi:DHA1 family inner membrane transport protein